MIHASEQAVLKSIIDLLTIKQIQVVHVRNTGNVIEREGKIFFGKGLNQRGAPDLIFCYRGIPVACEVKSATGKIRPEQIEWLRKWTDSPNNGHGFVARSSETVLEFLTALDQSVSQSKSASPDPQALVSGK